MDRPSGKGPGGHSALARSAGADPVPPPHPDEGRRCTPRPDEGDGLLTDLGLYQILPAGDAAEKVAARAVGLGGGQQDFTGGGAVRDHLAESNEAAGHGIAVFVRDDAADRAIVGPGIHLNGHDQVGGGAAGDGGGHGGGGHIAVGGGQKGVDMQMEEQEARLIQDVLNLSEDEVRQITRFRRGEGLLCIGYNHVPIAFHASQQEYWVVFKDVHEPIIERSVFEQVQQKRGKIRKRRTNEGEHNMFSGLLVCADCGCNLHFHFNQGNPEIKYFNCSNYKGNRGSCTSTHYVRVDFLEQVVLGEIRRLTKFASLYEDEFLKAVIGHSQQAAETDRKLKEKELKTLLARDEELDGLFERIYEDNVSGKLSDDRFAKMSRRYEDEQKELAEKIKKLRSEIEKQSSQAMTTDMFISLVRKYTRARKLTPRMLNELVEKIEVYNAEKIDGVWEQRLRIHYNCVGEITIPKMLPLPIPDVTVNTRKGVFVNYTPAEIAG